MAAKDGDLIGIGIDAHSLLGDQLSVDKNLALFNPALCFSPGCNSLDGQPLLNPDT